VVNNLLLTASCAAVFIGTLYPLALELVTGDKISVGPPYFNLTFGPLILPLLLLVPIGPLLSWKRADMWAATQRLWAAAAIAVVVAIAAAAWQWRGPWLAPLGVALGVWMVAAAVQELLFRTKLGKVELSVAWARLKGLPGAAWGMMLAHAGVGVFVIGVIGITAWKQEVVTVLKPGDTMEIGGRQITFVGESPVTGPNYSAERGNFRITSSSGATADVWSEKRVFKPSNQPTTEVGIQPYIDGDVYVVIGDRAGEGGRTVRAYFHPLVWFLWLGSAFMFLGGLISMLDRRYRVGAPKQSAAVKIQPAE
jgi:cytochrome c-type biogenesis protein CcmF